MPSAREVGWEGAVRIGELRPLLRLNREAALVYLGSIAQLEVCVASPFPVTNNLYSSLSSSWFLIHSSRPFKRQRVVGGVYSRPAVLGHVSCGSQMYRSVIFAPELMVVLPGEPRDTQLCLGEEE